jgi:hypothetical protein
VAAVGLAQAAAIRAFLANAPNPAQVVDKIHLSQSRQSHVNVPNPAQVDKIRLPLSRQTHANAPVQGQARSWSPISHRWLNCPA